MLIYASFDLNEELIATAPSMSKLADVMGTSWDLIDCRVRRKVGKFDQFKKEMHKFNVRKIENIKEEVLHIRI